MSREIKFRAWNGSRYITFDNHQYDLIYNDISGWNVAPNLPNYKGKWTTGESSETAEKFVLEQFTGLKDKNGVDIYENMILNKTFVIKYLKYRYVLFYISNMSKFEEIFNYENEFEITGEYSEI